MIDDKEPEGGHYSIPSGTVNGMGPWFGTTPNPLHRRQGSFRFSGSRQNSSAGMTFPVRGERCSPDFRPLQRWQTAIVPKSSLSGILVNLIPGGWGGSGGIVSCCNGREGGTYSNVPSSFLTMASPIFGRA